MTVTKSGSHSLYFTDFSDTPSKGRINNVYWYIGATLIIALIFAGTIAIYSFLTFLPPGLISEWRRPYDPNFPRSGYAESIMLWLSFVPTFIAPFLIYRYWHKLPLKRLITISEKIRWKRLCSSLLFVIFAYGIITLLEFTYNPSEFDDVFLHPDWGGYAILLGVTLIFLPLQSASEEILCRGYLNQGLTLMTKHPWIAFILTSGFFASLHLANPEADGQVLPYMFDTFVFGMAMCWLTYADEGLESAIGVHIGNNLFVFTLFGYEDPTLPPSAIWTGPEPVITWTDSLEGAIITLSITFIIITFNKWREKGSMPWVE